MPTLVDRLLDVAEDDVGNREVPMGSNDGPFVFGVVQKPYDPVAPHFYRYLPWCAMGRGRLLRAVGIDDWMRLASPSTQIMADLARSEGWVCNPTPGAAVVWPGTHVETLHSHISGTIWRCIGYNTSDQVKFTVRDVSTGVVFMEPQLAAGGAADTPDVLFYFHDTKPELLRKGGFRTKSARAAWVKRLSADWQSRASYWRNEHGFGVTIGPRVVYGPFRSRERRNARRIAVAQLYKDPVTDFKPFRIETRSNGTRVAVPAVPESVLKTLGLRPGTAQPEDLGKTT